ncbi:MAG: polysaccharide deacetylase family protein [Planctomycetota bacterium]
MNGDLNRRVPLKRGGAGESAGSMVYNFITLDVEEWYHANYEGVDFDHYRQKGSRLARTVDRLIELYDRQKVKITCFVLGQVAEEHPDLVRRLHDAGHEIASHGCNHKLVYTMDPEEFREDLKRSCALLEDITGERVCGFRAPSWSVTGSIRTWYYRTLEEQGLRYSSSVYPGKTFLYGIEGASDEPHFPEIQGRTVAVLEIPCPIVTILWKTMGFYIRLFPAWFMKRYIRAANKRGKPVFVYIHPREIDPDQHRLDLPFFTSMIHYWGIRGCEKKIERLTANLNPTWCTMRDYVTRRGCACSCSQAFQETC